MPPFFGNVTSLLADSFGGSSSLWSVLIAVFTAQALGLGVYMATRNIVACLVATGAALLFASFMGFVPIWVCFIFFAMGGAFVMLPVFLGGVHDVLDVKEKETMQISKPVSKPDVKNSKELILRIEKSSQKWAEYTNNLDGVLGIRTINMFAITNDMDGLDLHRDKDLLIHPRYDWYIADKMPDQAIFKIVGLHKKDASKNLVYLLGKNKELGEPFLTKLPERYIEVTDSQQYLSWISAFGRGNNGIEEHIDLGVGEKCRVI